MTMERIIRSDQYGLMWFGGIMTFKHLGLVTKQRNRATIFNWGKEDYSLTGKLGKLDQFVVGLLEYSAGHFRPQAGCDLAEIETYCNLLMEK